MIISSDYGRILRVLKFCGENNSPPFRDFLPLKYRIEICFGAELFLIVNRFSNFLQCMLGQTKRQILRKNDLHTIK